MNLEKLIKTLKDVKDSLVKDATDDKIKAKLKAEMDKRNFGEADATKHIIDRDTGTAQPKPKEPLLQSEAVEKSGYGPKNLGLYSPTNNQERKKNNIGDQVSNAGKNKNVKAWTTPGSATQAASEKAQQKVQNKKTKQSTRTLKEMSPEEQAKLKAQYDPKSTSTDLPQARGVATPSAIVRKEEVSFNKGGQWSIEKAEDFANIADKNKKNEARLKEERAKANERIKDTLTNNNLRSPSRAKEAEKVKENEPKKSHLTVIKDEK